MYVIRRVFFKSGERTVKKSESEEEGFEKQIFTAAESEKV